MIYADIIYNIILHKNMYIFLFTKMNENDVSDLINEMFPESYEFKVLSCENFEFGTDCVKFCIEMG